ncbi:transglutaminase domain-containing protein [Marinilabiliaceae bacterium JC017]|nr:transglutaminase domain-containing protein [Marinilabiliaceae bacterium JC017]
MIQRIGTGMLFTLLLVACAGPYAGVPEKYHALLEEAFIRAGANGVELEKALEQVPSAQKEGMAFLIAYMPQRDRETLSADFLLENVAYAYKARESFAWAKAVPNAVFLNEVLPYVSLNERRDNWRKDFFNRFSKYVAGCTTMQAAIDSVNKNIRDEVEVDYNTKREKPDQSPYESMRQNMASCSGLSILLTDAFRAVGIPSRLAGTPNWHDNRGNHNWNEVWIDGEWYFTEYYPSGLNKSWFLADAGKADANDAEHAIYASSFKPTDVCFPLVWDEAIKYVPAENVTDRYVRIYKAEEKAKELAANSVLVKVLMFREQVCSIQGDDRVAANVDVFQGSDQVGGGRTSGPTQDMNDVLEFKLEKNKAYKLKYMGEGGALKEVGFTTGDKLMELKLYMR